MSGDLAPPVPGERRSGDEPPGGQDARRVDAPPGGTPQRAGGPPAGGPPADGPLIDVSVPEVPVSEVPAPGEPGPEVPGDHVPGDHVTGDVAGHDDPPPGSRPEEGRFPAMVSTWRRLPVTGAVDRIRETGVTPVVGALRRVPRPLAVGVLIALPLLYTGGAWALTRTVPEGTRVAGVEVGGLHRDEALDRVRTAVDRARATPLQVRAGSGEAALDPAGAGLVFDPEPVAGELAGFSLDPRTLVRHLVGGGEVETPVDGQALDAALAEVARATDVAAQDAGIRFEGTRPVLVDAQDGQALDRPAAARRLRTSWLGATGPIALPVRTVDPGVGSAAARRALGEVAEAAVAAPLTVQVGARTVVLPPEDFAPSLKIAVRDNALQLQVDGKRLRRAALKAEEELETPPVDAEIVIEDGAPTIVPSTPGERIDPAKLSAAAVAALSSRDGPRVATVEPSPAEPELSTEQAEALGVKERVSTFATNLTSDSKRTENLRIAARTVNGTLVLPGETFSLNEVLGKRTPEKGYNQAPAINNGRLVRDYGGGVSQMATTIFNNVFFAGLQDVYHKPHSFYISRYPEGREATVNWPTVDLKWRNDSPHGVLVQAWVDSQVHVSFWSTKVWEIKAVKGPRTNPRQPDKIYDDSPECIDQAPVAGFDVTVTRVFLKGGSEVKRQTFRTTYLPEDEVICGPDPSAEPTATPSPPGD